MSASLLANELANLVSEAKRKNTDLRNAAEKSLQELKALPQTSEQQIAADLRSRPAFIDPFLIACETRNTKFAGSGVVCLQRLVISKGLPKQRLKDALDAFNACTELGLDLQLKVLQALPSLLQNYAEDLKDDLLASALQVCASLQSTKVPTVSGVASATLQQLVTALFEKVTDEDRKSNSIPTTAEVPGDDGPISLRPAAFDAYRTFRDLVLAAEERSTKFVQLKALSPDTSLELISSCLQGNPKLFLSHPELSSVMRANLFPLVTRILAEKQSFPVTVRSMRVLAFLLCRHFSRFPEECEVAIGLLTQSLDSDVALPWKRALSMEVIRDLFASGNLIVEAYATFDQAEVGGKPIIQDLLSAFVRLSAEKPAAIGLGQQSSVPIGPVSHKESGTEATTMEAAGGVAGVFGSAFGVLEAPISGISPQWSVPKTGCLDQLDKAEAPSLPDTYIYALVLECLNSLSEGLAKVVLPLTVHPSTSEQKSRVDSNFDMDEHTTHLSRSQSFRKRAVPLNPLEMETPLTVRARAVAALVDSCWPAVLATTSTFLNAALEEHYYRNLIKTFQRFAQVAGLLRLNTPRDALMTTLSKAAVPPHVLNSVINDGAKSPSTESTRVFSNPKGLLSVDSFASQASSVSTDRERHSSIEPARSTLSTRNLLCLRALLNLAIALGPTLGSAFNVVVDALKQADIILSTGLPHQAIRQATVGSQKGPDSAVAVQAFSAEVTAVEAAASRLLESTAEYPNDAFSAVLRAFLRLLSGRTLEPHSSPRIASPAGTPMLKERNFSGLPGISTFAEMQERDYHFVIPKLGDLARLNISRFVSNDPHESGWSSLIDELVQISSMGGKPRNARRASTDVLCRIAAEVITEVAEDDEQIRAVIQQRAIGVLVHLVNGLYLGDGDLTSTDLEIQVHVLQALRAILERSGDTVVSGWDETVAILGTAFERNTSCSPQQGGEIAVDWEHIGSGLVSVPVGRAAFEAAQLVCSDFLPSLPVAVMPSLTEVLYRFITQTEELNIALTTVTMAWNVADYLFGSVTPGDLAALAATMEEADDVRRETQKAATGRRAAQVLFVLFRLREAINGTKKEVRNATFQTMCSIFKNYGRQLEPASWELMLRNIVIRVATDDAITRLAEAEPDRTQMSDHEEQDVEMSRIIIGGISDTVAQHLRTIEQIKKLPSLWEVLLSTFEAYIDCERQSLNAAVFGALAKVVAQVETGSTTWTTPAYRTVALWLKRLPEQAEGPSSRDGNQPAFIAYVETASELYRLTRESMSSPQTRKFVDNLIACIEQSDGPKYSGDVSSLSVLQSKALDLLKSIRTDQANMPSRLIGAGAQLAKLHHVKAGKSRNGPSFVAMASEAIEWLTAMILSHLSDPEVLETGAVLSGIQSLRRLIADKYEYQTEYQSLTLWRRATIAAQKLARPILDLLEDPKSDRSVKTSLWAEFVAIASGVARANALESVTDEKVTEDQHADMESFKALESILTPRLGDPHLPDELRSSYCRSLFEASIVHQLEPGEIPGAHSSVLADLQNIRRGRVKPIPYSRREDMCYVCFASLIALASPRDLSLEHEKLAQAAAPLLVLRLAIPIRAYIADQPLRGRAPQPLCELEELLYAFEQIGTLRLHPNALAADPIANDKRGERAHLYFLYPLLMKAVATAGDRWSGAAEVLDPLQKLLKSLTPFP
ncbi:C-terminal region of Mon2 protein [Teratosphaeria destructans]|uniref:C-terminal region of Mon2 protein n=1 Tax=Teratosphaeria destructans TaxID=418781 RepID=A0A9W7W621_9PEZI|nr:C-terminal region of Mon2 protein [Teratosphaeria destructans]